MNLKQTAANILMLLQADPARYRCFGVYWYLIKELLKRYYTKDNLFLLGDYVDQTVIDRMPALPLMDALTEAMDQYQLNYAYGLGSNRVTDPDGEEFILLDADAGM
jgi:hypothetical protein